MEPVRTCVGCRQRAISSDLLRVVLESCHLVADPKSVLHGRGAWIHPSSDCLKLAVDRKAFGRAFKSADSIQSAGLAHFIEQAEMMLATK
jgi:predicted RNA-binding protein YlxR (DUF448 family)